MAGKSATKGKKARKSNPVPSVGKTVEKGHYKAWAFPSRNKYKAKKTVVDGITFDSKKEAGYYNQLKIRAAAGAITDLQRQVPVVLSVKGVKIGKIIIDFAYRTREGVLVYEDVKSKATITPIFRWKIKHLKAEHGITVKLVM